MNMKCPEGARVYLREFASGQLVASDTPLARSVKLEGNCFILYDEDNHQIAFYPADFVAAVLPLTSVGPAGANQQS